MLRKLVIICFMMLATTRVFGDPCDLADEANFPSASCSITALGSSFTELRFGRIDDLLPAATGQELILRSGISVFLLDENTQVLQESSSDDDDDDDNICINVDISDKQGQEIAYILEDDSLYAPRRITKIWILGCEVLQPK